MLQELSIKNFAIIAKLNVSFEEGMTVLTGETGAGKSIIIDAVGLLTGGRGSIDFIRQGSPKCVLEGQFNVNIGLELRSLLDDLGIPYEDDTLIVSREITTSGKNICRINSRLVNTNQLREIGRYLVDIQGQNDHQELLQPDRHLTLLDRFGGAELIELKEAYRVKHEAYKALLKRVKYQQENEKELAQRIDMLKFQTAEIAEADLSIGEEARLLEERQKLNNFHQIVSALNTTFEVLVEGERSPLDGVGYAMNEMESIETLDTEYAELSESVKSSYYQLQESANHARRLADTLEVDENRINEVEERLDIIRQMKRKYGETEADILDYWEAIDRELKASSDLGMSNEELEGALLVEEKQLFASGQALTAIRKKVASQLEKDILAELKELHLDKADFEVRFKPLTTGSYGETGLEDVEFYLTTNPGEPLKPLVKVASGGELSRIMLALKTIFTKTQQLTSIIFDEVDTGVSGRVAQGIANKIYDISRQSQVLCISHLPQVAAMADCHLHISKKIIDERTETFVNQLNEENRVAEVARMLAGEEITDLTREHARELLNLAHKK